MKKIDKTVLKEAANRLFFDLEDEQYNTLLDEFQVMVTLFKQLSSLDGIEKAIPMSFPISYNETYLRPDKPKKSLSINQVLKNAKKTFNQQIVLPKVVK